MIPVKPHIADHANLSGLEAYQRLYRQSLDDPESFWRDQTKRLSWQVAPEHVLDDDAENVDRSWFAGGLLNVSHNCVARHAHAHPHKTAIIWARNDGSYEHINFSDLKRHVSRLANVLKAHGVRRGDITFSVRIWQSPRVKAGALYPMEEGHILIQSIERIAIEDITGDLARRSGFDGVIDLLKTAKHGSGTNVYLVEFEYIPLAVPSAD
jgi:hypothetical protein